MSPTALVVYPPKSGPTQSIAEEIARGANQAGLQTRVAQAAPGLSTQGAELVFLGGGIYGLGGFNSQTLELVKSSKWDGVRACVFATHSGRGKPALEALCAELEKRGAKIAGTLLIELKGGLMAVLGKGTPDETDLARAYAFGERNAFLLLGKRPVKVKEKTRIRGYYRETENRASEPL